MKNPRRKILLGGLAGVVLTMLFPPFVVNPGGNRIYSVGFRFIFSPSGTVSGYVDIPLLLTEWLFVAIVCGILWVLTRDPKMPGVFDLVLRVMEKNADAKIEAARLMADAKVEAAGLKTDDGSYANETQAEKEKRWMSYQRK